MTEHDAFELRFAAAVHGYAGRVSSELDPVELAHGIASREPRRPGFTAAVAFRSVAIPSRVWVLLVLAALLTGLMAGLLAVGARPAEPPAVVPIGGTFTCPAGANPDDPGPGDQARPAGVPAMAFDDRAGKLVGLLSVGGRVETWTFDVCTNTWTQMHPHVEPGPLDSVHLIYDVDSDTTIAAEMGTTVWAYDLRADAWTPRGVAPVVANERWFGWAYDPVSGLVLVSVDRELWSYDVDTDTWAPISHAPWSSWVVLAYDASVDRVVAYTRTATWLLDVRTRTWSTSGADSPEIYTLWGMADYGPPMLYDATARRTVVSSVQGIRIAAYDASEDRWDVLVDVPDPDDLHPVSIPGRPENSWEAMAFDSVNHRLVGAGSFIDSGPDGRTLRTWDLLAFDMRSRAWTVLLEAR